MDRTIESLRCVIAGMFGVNSFKQSGISHSVNQSIAKMTSDLQAQNNCQKN